MKYGIVQGRLTKSEQLQSFPKDWENEFRIIGNIGYDFIELVAERIHNPENPIWTTKSKFPYLCPVICNDYIIDNGIDVEQSCRLIDQCHWFGCYMIIMPLFEAAENPDENKLNSILSYGVSKKVDVCFESTKNDGLYPVVYDTGNRASAGFDITKDILSLNNKIKHVHIKDKNKEGMNVYLGTGLVNFNDVAKSLKAINYDGMITFESVRGTDPVNTAKHNLQFIKFFLGEVK